MKVFELPSNSFVKVAIFSDSYTLISDNSAVIFLQDLQKFQDKNSPFYLCNVK